jgi:hypothetical protein
MTRAPDRRGAGVVDRRAAQRFPAAIELDLSVGDQRASAVAYDVSTDGCLLQCPPGLIVRGDRIHIYFPGMPSVCAQAVWTKHRNAGLQFDTPLPRSTVQRLAQGNSGQFWRVTPARDLQTSVLQRGGALRYTPLATAIAWAAAPHSRSLQGLQYAICAIFVWGAGWVLLIR